MAAVTAAILLTPLAPALAAERDPVQPGQTYPGNPAGDGPYTADWDSVQQHTPSPEWFKDAKFGVYWHWGAFSVPAYGNEWYGRNMYRDSSERNHHQQVYGNQFDTSASGFGYDKFITGGVDKNGNPAKFAPVLASKGGNFDPAAWVSLIKQSGAQFAGPVAEHHDGYSMWDSQVNEWNSVDQGPNLDLVKIFADEIRKQDMKYMVSLHHAYNINGFFDSAPTQPTDSLKKLYGQLPKDVGNQLWYDKLREVVDQVQPDLIWQDFGLDMKGISEAEVCSNSVCTVDEQQRLNFLSYYFNKGKANGQDVVTTYKHFDSGFTDKESVADYERGGPADITYPYWLTDDSVSTYSWSYTNGMGYYNSTQMIHSLLDRVSKNGNMLLNIAPQADGTIPQGQQDILRDIGRYLERNGEAVYSTRAWDVYGEGPTKAGGGSFTAPLSGNAQDIRYTASKDDTKLYATMLGWPGNGAKVSLTSLGGSSVDLSGLTGVKLFGAQAGDRIDLDWTQTANALQVTLPGSAPVQEQAYVIELSFADGVPVANGAQRVGLYPSTGGTGKGISIPVGDQSGEVLTERGLSGADIASMRVGSGVTVLAYASDDLTGTPVTYRSGAGGVITPTAPIGSIRVTADAVTTTNYLTANVNGLRWDTNGATTSGSPVVQKTAANTDAQKWQFVPTSDGYVRLVNPANGLAITSPSGSEGPGVTMNTPATGDAAQEWKPTASGSSWVFVNRASGSIALDSGGSVSSGSPLKQWSNNGSNNLLFTATDVQANDLEGNYLVTAEANGLAWDTNGSTTSGTDVVQKTSSSSTAQQWTFEPTSDGYYRIVNPATGRAIESVTTQQGSTVKLKDVSDAAGQQWKPVARGTGWIFQNRVDANVVLDSGGSVPSGSPLKQWTDNGSGNFRFVLTKAAPAATVQVDTGSGWASDTAGAVRVTVTGNEGTPSGEVTLRNGQTVLAGPVRLVNGAATLTVPANALAAGQYTLNVSYTADAPYANVLTPARVTVIAPAQRSLQLTTSTSARCVAGKALLFTTVKNTDVVSANITIGSGAKAKTFSNVAAGKTVSSADSTRQTGLPAGTVAVTGTGTDDQRRTASLASAYSAVNCG